MDREEVKKEEFDGKIDSSPSLRSCSDCQTTRTPLWRGGPDGPKSLCNACGIKYTKKRRRLLGLETGRTNRKKNTTSADRSDEIREILKMRFMAFSNRSRKLMAKLREEERAALLLMALSCGPSVVA